MQSKEETRLAKKAYYAAHREQYLLWARQYKARNKKSIEASRAAYYQKNKTKEMVQNKEWFKNNPNAKSKYDKKYRLKHLEKIKAHERKPSVIKKRRAYQRELYVTNINYNIACRLRANLTQALRLYGGTKTCSVDQLIGCTIQELKDYLESKFLPGMCWKERRKFHIDHIKPVSSFDMSEVEQQMACFHYSNLRPLWGRENQRKGKKIQKMEKANQ